MNPFENLLRRVEELERCQANMVREGRVTDVDAQKGVRIAIADNADGTVVKSPWVKPSEHAGTMVSWNPQKLGQHVKLISPGGEIGSNSMAVPHSYANGVDQPSSDLDEPMFKVGNAEFRIKDGQILLKVGTTEVLLTETSFRAKVGTARVAVKSGYAKLRVASRWVVVTSTEVRSEPPPVTLPDPDPEF